MKHCCQCYDSEPPFDLQAAHVEGTSKAINKRRRKRLQPQAASDSDAVGQSAEAATTPAPARSAAAPGPASGVAPGGGDMGVWAKVTACGRGPVSTWDPDTGQPLSNLTPEQAAAAISEAEAAAKASKERRQHAKGAFGQHNVTPMDRLRQVAAQVEKCDKIVRMFTAQRPVSSKNF